MNREIFETWLKKGSVSYGERLVQKTKEILQTHKPEPLENAVQEKIRSIAARAEKELSEIKFVA